MKLSVAIATYNEEDTIARCLGSVAGFASEIVVVDGSSTDNTVSIAKKYKARIIVTDNPRIFHINKQKAINACHGEWILQLDADEVVTKELSEEIIQTINPVPEQARYRAGNQQLAINGYWISRKNYFLGRWLSKGGQYPDYTLRLYRRGKGRLPCKSVHEQAEVNGKVGYLINPLLHYPYPNFSHYLEHFSRYTSILANEFVHDKLAVSLTTFIQFIVVKPLWWFLSTFIRHKGFYDGYAGLMFSFFSALRFPTAYIKFLKNYHRIK